MAASGGEGETRVTIPAAPAGENYGATNGGAAGDGPPPAYSDKLPTYDEVTDENAAPPSYESLYGEFRQVGSPSGFVVFLRKAIGLLIGTASQKAKQNALNALKSEMQYIASDRPVVREPQMKADLEFPWGSGSPKLSRYLEKGRIAIVVAAVCIALLSIIPIAMIVIGSLNIYKCPVERYIPIYLVVAGAFGLFKSITNFYYRQKRRRDGQEHAPEENVNPNPFDGILNCFLLGWFIAGSYWVYHVYEPSYNVGDVNYCDKLCYLFAFVLITITYVFTLVFMFMLCCCGCLALCFGRKGGQETAA